MGPRPTWALKCRSAGSRQAEGLLCQSQQLPGDLGLCPLERPGSCPTCSPLAPRPFAKELRKPGKWLSAQEGSLMYAWKGKLPHGLDTASGSPQSLKGREIPPLWGSAHICGIHIWTASVLLGTNPL